MPIEQCKEYAGISAQEKLASMGLDITMFRKAAQMGYAERANCTVFDPVTTPGTEAWRYPTRFIRQTLNNHGWRLDNPMNLPLVISDKYRISITVSSGDEITGLFLGSKQPKTKNPKGSLIKAAVHRNVDQLDLFPSTIPENVSKFRQTLDYPTWVFLLYITNEEIRSELSLPSEMDGSDHIVGWSERISISVMPPDQIAEDDEPDVGPDILPQITAKI